MDSRRFIFLKSSIGSSLMVDWSSKLHVSSIVMHCPLQSQYLSANVSERGLVLSTSLEYPFILRHCVPGASVAKIKGGAKMPQLSLALEDSTFSPKKLPFGHWMFYQYGFIFYANINRQIDLLHIHKIELIILPFTLVSFFAWLGLYKV